MIDKLKYYVDHTNQRDLDFIVSKEELIKKIEEIIDYLNKKEKEEEEEDLNKKEKEEEEEKERRDWIMLEKGNY